MTPTPITWESETVHIAGIAMQVARAGSGPPLLVLPPDIRRPARRPPGAPAVLRRAGGSLHGAGALAPGLRSLDASRLDAQRARCRRRPPVAARLPRAHARAGRGAAGRPRPRRW